MVTSVVGIMRRYVPPAIINFQGPSQKFEHQPAPLCFLQFMQWQMIEPAFSGGGALIVTWMAPQLHSPVHDIFKLGMEDCGMGRREDAAL